MSWSPGLAEAIRQAGAVLDPLPGSKWAATARQGAVVPSALRHGTTRSPYLEASFSGAATLANPAGTP
jgi:hypothetical protein